MKRVLNYVWNCLVITGAAMQCNPLLLENAQGTNTLSHSQQSKNVYAQAAWKLALVAALALALLLVFHQLDVVSWNWFHLIPVG